MSPRPSKGFFDFCLLLADASYIVKYVGWMAGLQNELLQMTIAPVSFPRFLVAVRI
jgi:hypothetical protein